VILLSELRAGSTIGGYRILVTPTEILNAIKQVDGAGSGLDADLLDGMLPATTNTASTIVQRDASGNFSAGTITANLTGKATSADKWATARTISLTGSVTGSTTMDGSGNITIATTTNHTHSYLALTGGTLTGDLTLSGATADRIYFSGSDAVLDTDGNMIFSIDYNSDTVDTEYYSWKKNAGATEIMKLTGAGVLTVNGNTVFHAGNDGSGSGLDADKLDGKEFADIDGNAFLYSLIF
jgi:hypothetical protein